MIIYNNTEFKINDIVLYKKNNNYRICKYNIKNIKNNLITLTDIDNDSFTINLKNNNIFLKKYIINDSPEEIFCDLINKTELIFSFKCNYCNIEHKTNKLGLQDHKCIYPYSPYSKCGYILKMKYYNFDIVNFSFYENYNKLYNYYKNKYILNMIGMEFENFSEYLIYNYKILLEKKTLSHRTIIWYVRYITQFVNGKLCDNYGKKHFPYINNTHIKFIKENYNTRSSNLITTLNKFINIITTEDFLFKLDKYNDDLIKLKEYYNNECSDILNRKQKNSKLDKDTKKKKTKKSKEKKKTKKTKKTKKKKK